MFAAAVSALLGATAAKQYDKNKWNRIAGMLEHFKNGELGEISDLDDDVDARIAFLLEEIRKEILSTSGREKEENNQIKGMISDIAHQLRIPLANIRMYEELLEEQEGLNGEERLCLANIREAAVKSQWLIKNLVNISRLETGAIAFKAGGEFLRETLVEAVQEMLGFAAERQIEICMGDFQDLRVIQNRRWTREVFANLLENALKYSLPHTRITISVKRQVSYAAVSVKDQGIGVPKEERRKIFQRFYRGSNAEDAIGSGLGLYLVRLILLKENGNVILEEADGGGSIFIVFLKLAE